MANKKYKLADGNMWATDGIHDFGQNKTQRTINSEVNTALGGKAPTNHASTSTTYGKGTSSNYGHVKISDSLTDTTPAATGGVVPSMKAVSDLNGAINAIGTVPIAVAKGGTGANNVRNAQINLSTLSAFELNRNQTMTVDISEYSSCMFVYFGKYGSDPLFKMFGSNGGTAVYKSFDGTGSSSDLTVTSSNGILSISAPNYCDAVVIQVFPFKRVFTITVS